MGGFFSCKAGRGGEGRGGKERKRGKVLIFVCCCVCCAEPGYYKDGEFGIRIENILLVREHPEFPNFLAFEHVTFVPLCRALIDVELLSGEEREWVDRYHRECREKVGGLLEEGSKAKEWLWRETEPL